MTGKPKIAIDPGHNCSPDTGASALMRGTLVREDHISLEVGQKLKAICQDHGIPTIWCLPVSASSVQDSLDQRVAAANDGGATIYISIHCNVYEPTELPRGTEAYATSIPGKALAKQILTNLAEFGWKNRGVKTMIGGGKPPYVVAQTNAVAVLVEICFLDSAVDRIILAQVGPEKIAQAIFDAIVDGTSLKSQPIGLNLSKQSPNPVESASAPPGGRARNVQDAIDAGTGSTSEVDGLSDQIIGQMGTGNLMRLSAPNFESGENCDPYFQPHVHASLTFALKSKPNLKMTCNSGYRSIVRQIVLYENYRRKTGGIRLAALPGKSSHEGGCAVDISEWQQWKPILEATGWDWQGSEDPVHFQLSGMGGTPAACIKAFQQLHNKYNPTNLLVADGVFGEKTRQAMLNAPAEGWLLTQSEFHRALKLGTSGRDVVLLAQQLRRLKIYNYAIEHNRFELPLETAVKRYQLSIGLVSDGIAGRSTLQELFGDREPLFAGFITGKTLALA